MNTIEKSEFIIIRLFNFLTIHVIKKSFGIPSRNVLGFQLVIEPLESESKLKEWKTIQIGSPFSITNHETGNRINLLNHAWSLAH